MNWEGGVGGKGFIISNQPTMKSTVGGLVYLRTFSCFATFSFIYSALFVHLLKARECECAPFREGPEESPSGPLTHLVADRRLISPSKISCRAHKSSRSAHHYIPPPALPGTFLKPYRLVHRSTNMLYILLYDFLPSVAD